VTRGKSWLRLLIGAPGGVEAARQPKRRSTGARQGRGKGPGEEREKGPEQVMGNDKASSKGFEDGKRSKRH
jgi:hypothetical protein